MTPAQQPSLPPEALELLEQMHNIFVPQGISWWPPAFGWWAAAISLLGALVLALIVYLIRHRQEAYRRTALKLLDQLREQSDAALPAEANRLLKRVALAAFPSEKLTINQAFGENWVDWLNARCPDLVFSGAAAAALARGGYQRDALYPREELLDRVRRWIATHQRTLRSTPMRRPAHV